MSKDQLLNLAANIGQLLVTKNLSLAVAESCTGGLLASIITDISGSSSYFHGGAITYSNWSKEAILNVPSKLLADKGAVSEEVALAMAEGARRLFKTDIALSTTGIAGPTGGTPEKPVGLVYIGLASQQTTVCERHIWQGSRVENKAESVEAALRLLEKYLYSNT